MKCMYQPFIDVLEVLDASQVYYYKDLKKSPALLERYGQELYRFIGYVFGSKSTSLPNGTVIEGNASRIEQVETEGITTRDDLREDAVLRFLHLEKIVFDNNGEKRTVLHQYYTLYRALTNMTLDAYRLISFKSNKNERKIVHFQDTAYSYKDGSTCTYEDLLSTEDLVVSHVMSNEREEARKKRSKLLQKLQAVRRPSEVLVHLSSELTPRDIAKLLIDRGTRQAVCLLATGHGISEEVLVTTLGGTAQYNSILATIERQSKAGSGCAEDIAKAISRMRSKMPREKKKREVLEEISRFDNCDELFVYCAKKLLQMDTNQVVKSIAAVGQIKMVAKVFLDICELYGISEFELKKAISSEVKEHFSISSFGGEDLSKTLDFLYNSALMKCPA